MRLVFLVALVAATRHETLLRERNSTVSAGGRRLVWVGHDKVGLGNVLAGFPDLYFPVSYTHLTLPTILLV